MFIMCKETTDLDTDALQDGSNAGDLDGTSNTR